MTFSGTHVEEVRLANTLQGEARCSTNCQNSRRWHWWARSGVICLTGDDDDFVLAELRDEELVVRVQLKSGVFETRLHPPPSSMPLNAAQRRFNDDRWHKLVVSREAREVTLPSCLAVCMSVRPSVCLFLVLPSVLFLVFVLLICHLFNSAFRLRECLALSVSDRIVTLQGLPLPFLLSSDYCMALLRFSSNLWPQNLSKNLQLWNQLPTELKKIQSQNIFKRHFETLLIRYPLNPMLFWSARMNSVK